MKNFLSGALVRRPVAMVAPLLFIVLTAAPSARLEYSVAAGLDGCPDERPTYVFKAGETLVFTNIMFPTDKWDILPASFPVLDEIVRSLQQQPWVRVRVEGHTDDVGRDGKNLVLSQQRALAVVNYLVGAGIDARRLEHAGYGETRPVAANTDDRGRAQNRRVELVTLDGGAAAPVPTPAPASGSPPAPTVTP